MGGAPRAPGGSLHKSDENMIFIRLRYSCPTKAELLVSIESFTQIFSLALDKPLLNRVYFIRKQEEYEAGIC